MATISMKQQSRNQKTWRFFASSRLRGKACPESTTKTRRREELEIHLHGELDNPSRSRASNDAGCTRIDRCLRQTEVGVIEEIEEFAAELHAPVLGHAEVLVDAH